MQSIETFLIWPAVYVYALVTLMMLIAFVFNKERLLDISGWLLAAAFVAHTIVFIMRWHYTGYVPANGEFENGLTSGWFAIGLTVYVFFRHRGLRGAGLFTVPVTLIFLGYGLMVDPAARPLSVSFKSSWLLVHVLFAQFSYGSYAIASGMGILYLMKSRREKKGDVMEGGFYGRLPKLQAMEESMFRFAVFGFIAEAVMIASGAIWAKELWGSFWAWDPVEVWSLLSWLVYGLIIHLRVSLGWRDRRLAWLMVFAILTVIITYWGIDLMVESTRHMFGVE